MWESRWTSLVIGTLALTINLMVVLGAVDTNKIILNVEGTGGNDLEIFMENQDYWTTNFLCVSNKNVTKLILISCDSIQDCDEKVECREIRKDRSSFTDCASPKKVIEAVGWGHPCSKGFLVRGQRKNCLSLMLSKQDQNVDSGFVQCWNDGGSVKKFFVRGPNVILADDLAQATSWRDKNRQLLTFPRSPTLQLVVRKGPFLVVNDSMVSPLGNVIISCQIMEIFDDSFKDYQLSFFEIHENRNEVVIYPSRQDDYIGIPFHRMKTFSWTLSENVLGIGCRLEKSFKESLISVDKKIVHFKRKVYFKPQIENSGNDRSFFFRPFSQDENDGLNSLNCVAFGNPPPNITWHFGGAILNPLKYPQGRVTRVDFKNRVESILYLNRMTKKDEGTYTCTASNRVGTSILDFKVKIYSWGPRIIIPPKIGSVEKPQAQPVLVPIDMTQLTCWASGLPTPSIFWTVNGVNLTSDDSQINFSSDKSLSKSELRLPVIDYSVHGIQNYSCIASNFNGTDQIQFIVGASCGAKINRTRAHLIFVKKMDVKSVHVISCTALGIPRPRITWLKDGLTIYESYSKWGLNSIESFVHIWDHEGGGNYTCIANNDVDKGDSFVIRVQFVKDSKYQDRIEHPGSFGLTSSDDQTMRSTMSIWVMLVISIGFGFTITV